jgi:hypothetical protein
MRGGRIKGLALSAWMALLALSLPPPAAAQPPENRASYDTSFLGCDPKRGSTRVVRSPVLASATHEAYAEVQAAWSDTAKDCGVTARLFVTRRDRAGDNPKPVFEKTPTPEQLGNGLRVADWSPDGRQLAFEFSWWQPNSDVAGKRAMLYDIDRGVVREVALQQIFRSTLGRSCNVRLDGVRGFTPEGEMVVDVGDHIDVYEPSTAPACFRKNTRWAIAKDARRARSLPAGYAVQHFGK